jgi:hypothetical protein
VEAAALKPFLILFLGLPLAAQSWDLRWEVPFPQGQNLPQTLLTGTGQLLSGDLDTGKGMILSLNRRLLVLGPVLRLEGGFELSRFTADGQVTHGTVTGASALRQSGVGVALNAQFWIPFTGIGGELGLVQRFQNYRYEVPGARVEENLSRTWLRVGIRWRLPLPGPHPYLAASYQEPLSKDRPVQLGSVADLAGYLAVQGSGQEFERLWTFGVGIAF